MPVATIAGLSLLRLTATVKDEPFENEPAGMVTFVSENLHNKPLAVFSATFIPKQANTGKVLTTATEFAGIRCDDVAVRFEGRFLCAFEGQACTAANIEVQQVGLASVAGLGS